MEVVWWFPAGRIWLTTKSDLLTIMSISISWMHWRKSNLMYSMAQPEPVAPSRRKLLSAWLPIIIVPLFLPCRIQLTGQNVLLNKLTIGVRAERFMPVAVHLSRLNMKVDGLNPDKVITYISSRGWDLELLLAKPAGSLMIFS